MAQGQEEPTNQTQDVSSVQLREIEVTEEIRSVLRIVANWMAIPLFMLFWLADLLYVPEQKWIFLIIRLMIIPACILAHKIAKKVKTSYAVQWTAMLYAVSLATDINVMIYLAPEASTSYYAGLNMIAIGGLSFIPFSRRFFVGAMLGIYLPYVAIVSPKAESVAEFHQIVINGFFIVGTIVISFLIRHFNENLRIREINSQLALKNEIAGRDVLIREKTEEAVRLNNLSTQFSPQVVRAIREGTVDLEKGVHRAQICAIFVDIVGSTERVVRLDQHKVDKVLARFMDTVVSTFLKYDLTIDKFQGDGILAFANDPIPHPDFIQRTCYAALEIRRLLQADREFYVMNWKRDMQIRMGISLGYANVGFYGNKKFFRSYTAIGAPLPMASRLTNLAEPDQILIDSDIAEVLQAENFQVKCLGERVIKGFEGDQNIIFELTDTPVEKLGSFEGHLTCPQHKDSVLFLDSNEKGHFVMKCRHCDFVLDQYSMQMLNEISSVRPPKTG